MVELFRRVLSADRPAHILMVGDVATAKSLFLSELARLPGAELVLGGRSTKVGSEAERKLRRSLSEYVVGTGLSLARMLYLDGGMHFFVRIMLLFVGNMRDDKEYLLHLTRAIDELEDEVRVLAGGGHALYNCWCGVGHRRQVIHLGDLRDYFLYLTLDAVESSDSPRAKELVSRLERCEAQSRTHAKFFFALAQLLSLKHEIVEVLGERIHREEFEESWKRTAGELGLEKNQP